MMTPYHYWQLWYRFQAKAEAVENDAELRDAYLAVADAYEWLAQSVTRALNERIIAA